jgi:hypothetical protein
MNSIALALESYLVHIQNLFDRTAFFIPLLLLLLLALMLATINPLRSYFAPQTPSSVILSTVHKPTAVLKAFQGYEYILVLDVEATCEQGTDFAYANEIIVSLSNAYFSSMSHLLV